MNRNRKYHRYLCKQLLLGKEICFGVPEKLIFVMRKILDGDKKCSEIISFVKLAVSLLEVCHWTLYLYSASFQLAMQQKKSLHPLYDLFLEAVGIDDRCLVSLSRRFLFHGNSAESKLTIHEKFTLLRNHRRSYFHYLLLCHPIN